MLLPDSAAAEDGARAFTPCRACHSLDPAERGLPGPNLSGLIGRAVAGNADFDYSPVLRKARDEGLRWDAKRLETIALAVDGHAGCVHVSPRNRTIMMAKKS